MLSCSSAKHTLFASRNHKPCIAFRLVFVNAACLEGCRFITKLLDMMIHNVPFRLTADLLGSLAKVIWFHYRKANTFCPQRNPSWETCNFGLATLASRKVIPSVWVMAQTNLFFWYRFCLSVHCGISAYALWHALNALVISSWVASSEPCIDLRVLSQQKLSQLITLNMRLLRGKSGRIIVDWTWHASHAELMLLFYNLIQVVHVWQSPFRPRGKTFKPVIYQTLQCTRLAYKSRWFSTFSEWDTKSSLMLCCVLSSNPQSIIGQC